ncbi:MAG: hypothetical protein KUL82_02820, partial [Bdellovibrio sp.]|nr:hypothetical protein [Bdellovibrio sp.]
MNNDRIDTYFYIFIITIFSLLLFGTVVSSILKKTKPDNETFQKVFIIVRSWWYIATPIIISFLLGAHAVLLLFFFVTCFIAIEFTRYLSDKSMQKPMRFVLIATTLLQYLAILKNWNTAFYAFIPLVAIWVLPLVIFISKNPQNLPRTAALVLGSLLMSYYISHVPAMPLLQHELWQSEHQALLAVLVLIFITET